MYTQENAVSYTGTKTLKAWPATRGEYNAYRGWEMPHDEDPSEPGYLVEYEKGMGNHNHPNHEGYVSWSPANVFEGTYKKTPETWQDRVTTEAEALEIKLADLNHFLEEPVTAVGTGQMELMREQRDAMATYLRVLQQRLA